MEAFESSNEIFLTKTKFEHTIDKMVSESDYTYIEAILEFCEENDVNPEDVVKYISNNMKKKIEVEAILNNFLPKKATLSFIIDDELGD